MRYLIILFLLISSNVYAGTEELSKETVRMESEGKTLTQKETTQLLDRGWRDRRPGEKPVYSKTYRPEDWENDGKRGSTELVRGNKNYSRLKIIDAPNGTIFRDMNFSQLVPGTDVFTRLQGVYGENLTFIDCNLVNVKTYPDWIINGGNTAQIDFVNVGFDQDSEQADIDNKGVFVAKNFESIPKGRSKAQGAFE